MKYFTIFILLILPGEAFSTKCRDEAFITRLIKNFTQSMNNHVENNSFANGTIQWGEELSNLPGDNRGEREEKLAKREGFLKFLKKGIFFLDLKNISQEETFQKEKICTYPIFSLLNQNGPITGFATSYPDDSEGPIIIQDVFLNPDYSDPRISLEKALSKLSNRKDD